MRHRTLSHSMTSYRIGDPAGSYPIYSPEGARKYAGRWHRRGQRVIYTAEHYSTAMLERLVHYSGVLPKGQHFIEIGIPAGVSYEVVTVHSLTGWDSKNQHAARLFGSQWIEQKRSALLLVPSVVARMERNVLINPDHTDASQILPGLEQPVRWDERLF